MQPTPGEGGGASPRSEDVTRILRRVAAGDVSEANELAELVYDELRGLALGYLSRERQDHTLQPTALANEAWLRLIDQERVEWRGRQHFLAVAAQAMRRILVDHARKRRSGKRGGEWGRVPLDGFELAAGQEEVDVVDLDGALARLEELSERQARVVELRFFGGLELKEAAEVLEVSLSTVERDWRFASAWLSERLSADAT